MADHRRHGESHHHQRDVPVPTVPGTGLLVIEPEFGPGVLDRPAPPLGRDQGLDRRAGRAPRREAGPLAASQSTACGFGTHVAAWRRDSPNLDDGRPSAMSRSCAVWCFWKADDVGRSSFSLRSHDRFHQEPYRLSQALMLRRFIVQRARRIDEMCACRAIVGSHQLPLSCGDAGTGPLTCLQGID